MLVVSDVHANLPALQAVFRDAPDHHIEDGVLCCGDLVGYHPWPDEVVDRIAALATGTVRGNHDEAVITGSTFGIDGAAGAAIRWTMDTITETTRAFLADAPYTWRSTCAGQDVFMVHGSPRRPIEEYVYPEQVVDGFLADQGVSPDIMLLGHTHVPFAETVAGTLVVNPGSVGQPRDGDPRASYALLDAASQTVTHHRVAYDIDTVVDRIDTADLPHAIANRLRAGR